MTMEKAQLTRPESQTEESKNSKLYTPYPGADEKYDDGQDWRIYNPDKYRDPAWSPDKE